MGEQVGDVPSCIGKSNSLFVEFVDLRRVSYQF